MAVSTSLEVPTCAMRSGIVSSTGGGFSALFADLPRAWAPLDIPYAVAPAPAVTSPPMARFSLAFFESLEYS